jgi:peptidoglycan hydrolase-like protein with peptidoglycan-binding domain
MTGLALIAVLAVLTGSPQPVIEALDVQVRLDRAGFSAGEIDGRMGANTRRALEAYGAARGITSRTPEDVVAALAGEQNVPALAKYRISDADVQGPFAPEIPEDLMEQAKLPSLGYRNALESVAEKLHASPALLKRLNPEARFAAGEEISAPNVRLDPVAPPAGVLVVRVSKSDSALRVEAQDGKPVFYAPVTTGSEHDPLPIDEYPLEPQVPLQPRVVLGRGPEPRQGCRPGGAEQSGRCRVGRSQQGALRPSRHA